LDIKNDQTVHVHILKVTPYCLQKATQAKRTVRVMRSGWSSWILSQL